MEREAVVLVVGVGLMGVALAGIFIDMRGWQERVHLRLMPYFAWANRGEGRIAEWLKRG